MNRQLAETIIRYLSFSEGVDNPQDSLGGFSLRQWRQTFEWLDNANLALYLLQKLRDTHDDGKLPPAVRSRLEQNYSKNRLRVDEMASQFAVVNEKFQQGKVQYAVVKGFSLVPEFCPNANLRHQSDLDYLVDEHSLPVAQQVLSDLGYFLKSHETAEEWVFWKGPISHSSTSSEQYDAKGRYVIEMHLAIWTAENHGIEMASQQFSPARTVDHEWQGLHFPALYDEDAFLLQVLHVMQHLLAGCMRMFWLYEIAYCLHRRENDTVFWQRVEHRAQADVLLPQFVAIIAGLAAQFFHAPLPTIVQTWKTNLQPPVKIWLENYGRRVAFEKLATYELDLFPTSKLVLFLHRQFLHNGKRRRHFTRKRLLPWARPVNAVRSVRERPSVLFDSQWRRRQVMFHRIVFHAGSGLRYLCEIPRWLWLNRKKAPCGLTQESQSAPSAVK